MRQHIIFRLLSQANAKLKQAQQERVAATAKTTMSQKKQGQPGTPLDTPPPTNISENYLKAHKAKDQSSGVFGTGCGRIVKEVPDELS